MKLQNIVVHSIDVSVLAAEKNILADGLSSDDIVTVQGIFDQNFPTNYDVEVF